MTAGKAAVPRYLQVSEALEAAIADGRYPVGGLLPTEIELCDTFSVSRHTVREALRRLTDAGLVQRRQGSGSQVIAAHRYGTYVHAMRSLGELFQYAADTRFRIDDIREVVPDPAEAPGVGRPGEVWLIVRGLRLDKDEGPICWSDVFIARSFAGIAGELRGHQGAIYSLIEARFGVQVADVDQEITALPMPAGPGAALNVSRKAWAVRVIRRYRDAAGALMLASVNHHPADRFSYSMRLKREGRGFG